MRKTVLIIVMLLPFVVAWAQENHYYVDHPHSVTVSTGLPCILASLFPPGSPDNSDTMEGWRTGTGYKTIMPVNVNVGYNYQFNRRWEMAVFFTTSGHIYTKSQYPQSGESEDGSPIFDWKGNPTESSTHYKCSGNSISVMGRFYWLAKSQVFQMYSAAGIGYFWPVYPFLLFPTLTPVGARVGGKHWYGQAELTIGTAATLFLLGVGYRF